MSNESANPWKLATIGILLVGATALATTLIVGRDSKTEPPTSQTAQISEAQVSETGEKAAPTVKVAPVESNKPARTPHSGRNTSAVPPPPPYSPQAAYPPQPAYPPQSVMEACNRYASEQVNSKTEEVLKNAALGAVLGAAVGAAGGAIAGGGSGAGKGAGIGGVAGAAGGSLYGLNENKSHDAQYQAAYASCMRSKGF
jgi:hypothetical protein